MTPLWVAALATGAKSFRDNPVIGSAALNRRGLHARRAKLAHAMAWRRRARLAHMISPEDRAAFDRDGFVLREEFLPREEFEQLRERIFAHAAPAREMLQGDTVTRRFAVDPEFIAAVPEIKGLLANPRLARPQPLCRLVRPGAAHLRPDDPEPHPRGQAGSADRPPHRHVSSDGEGLLFPDRRGRGRGAVRLRAGLAPADGEAAEVGIRAEHRRRRRAATGSPRAARSAPPPPRSPRWDLRRRAPSRSPPTRWSSPTPSASTRAAFPSARRSGWRSGPTGGAIRSCRGPGLDPCSLPGLAERRIPFLWQARDFLDSAGVCCRQPWKDVGKLRPQDPPVRRAV